MFRVHEVVCFGEGAGANILARFAVSKLLPVCIYSHLYSPTPGGIEQN